MIVDCFFFIFYHSLGYIKD